MEISAGNTEKRTPEPGELHYKCSKLDEFRIACCIWGGGGGGYL